MKDRKNDQRQIMARENAEECATRLEQPLYVNYDVGRFEYSECNEGSCIGILISHIGVSLGQL